MNKFIAFAIFFALIIICFSVFNIKDTIPLQTISEVNGKIGTTPIKLEVSSNPITRSKGLSNRIALREGEGMLFVFLQSDIEGFWMKDMKFPIDIIWINENLKVIGIHKNVSPDSYPEVFYSPAPVKFVIETPAGFSDQFGVKIGESVSIESQNLIFKSTF